MQIRYRGFFSAGLLMVMAVGLSACVGGHLVGPHFVSWKHDLLAEASARGISWQTLNAALGDFTPIPRIVELDRAQPEGTKNFERYVTRLLSPARIEKGRRMYAENRELLDKIGRQYGVQPRFIIALWGIETNYGGNMGGYPVPKALATLAYDGRRGDFFREELLKSLEIIDQGHVELAQMNGSWAGAMGQCQFMPSSFQRFAVDYNGDGRKDIWGSKEDTFASMANYLSTSGWDSDITWGRRIKLPPDFDRSLVGVAQEKPISAWRALGVVQWDGKPLPPVNALSASVVLPDDKPERAYLVYNNYRTLLKWNRSTYFATAVGLLADHVAFKDI